MTEELNHIGTLIRSAYQRLDDAGEIEISAARIAETVFADIDPETVSPVPVRWSCLNDLRRRAEGVMRQHMDDEARRVEGDGDMFSGYLQTRYPCKRGGQDVYVPPIHMTKEEGMWNASRLRKEAATKTAHADAVESYFMSRNRAA